MQMRGSNITVWADIANFTLQPDVCFFMYLFSYDVYQLKNIRRGRTPRINDEIRMLRADLGTAD